MNRRSVLFTGLGVGAGLALPRPVRAQEAPPERFFDKVIPRPTGQNGYEELVLAADEVRTSRLYDEAENMFTGVPLALKREVLRDPPVIRALALLELGLSKPIRSPREEIDDKTTFGEMGGFRRIARLLGLRQYVFLADGRVPDAIATMRLCLRFGYAIQLDSMIGGLVAIAIQPIGMATIAGHLGQLSARDCEDVLRASREQLARPDPFPAILTSERRFAARELDEAIAKGPAAMEETLLPKFDPEDPDDSETRRDRDALRRAASAPGGLDALAAQIMQRVDRAYDRMLAELNRPPWERARVSSDTDRTLADRLSSIFTSILDSVGDRYIEMTTRLRLLACHAGICRHLWERERLPASLEPLGLGDLAIDPFTGSLLQYQVSGRTYRLTSVGPTTFEGDPRAVDGRRPVSVVPGE
jgi:hypothetical protein